MGNLAPAQGLATNANSGARLRRSFELNEIPRRLAVRVLGSGRTRLFLNGELVKTLHTSDLADYVPTSVAFLSSDAIKKLRPGRNVLALEFLPKSGSAPATVATGSELKHLDVSLFVPE